jgi:signal transduction histidine kinase
MRLRQTEHHLRMRFDATLAERSRLAGELHDTLLQGFTGVTLQLQAVLQRSRAGTVEDATELSRVLDLADLSLRDARQMVWDLRAPELDAAELPAVLEHAAREEVVGTSITLHFNLAGTPYQLSPLAETAVLRVAREAVMNAVKHAASAHIEMLLTYTHHVTSLSVRDDGLGMSDSSELDATHRGHWGVFGMRERAARAGGMLEIVSSAGAGTTVTLSLPRAVDGTTV